MRKFTSALAAAAFALTLSSQALAADPVPAVTPVMASHALASDAWSPDSLRAKVLSFAKSWQCVTFARALSGLQIFGDAWTWWDGANGKYARGKAPESGAVLVFQRHGSMSRGHVAVVSQVLTERIVQITHANWSPIGGRRGQVEQDVTAIDVSDAGDWSRVKVWYGPSRDLGGSVYPTYGFIYQPTTLQGGAAGDRLDLAAYAG